MKVLTPEIIWHNKQPLLSADFHRGVYCSRLATGGADNDVKIWKVFTDDKVRIVFMASLSRHTKAVNVVRFSPNGEFLASAGDDTVIHIWRLNDDPSSQSAEGNLVGGTSSSSPTSNKENWSCVKLLRGHLEDIYDMCWSPDSSCLVSGSVDNSAIVWDVHKGQQMAILKDSKQYIQGVTWDPLGEFIATLSTDRCLRVYSVHQRFKCVHTVSKLTLDDSRHMRLWVDEVNSFFRRLTFTPDGSFLVAPAGRFENEVKVTNSSYVFVRSNLSKPALRLPGEDKATVVVRCCPVLFELMEQPKGSMSMSSLAYRMVYAVASLDSVFLYDTQHTPPFAYISKIHYSGITDLTWSNDGLILLITSSDCYCTLVTFDPNELGVPLASDKLPPNLSLSTSCSQAMTSLPSVSEESTTSKQDTVITHKPSPSSKTLPASTADSATVKPRRIRPTLVSTPTRSSEATPSSDHTTIDSVSSSSTPSVEITEIPNTAPSQKSKDDRATNEDGTKAPRRVSFTTLTTYTPAKQSSSKGEQKENDCIIIE